MDKLVLLLRWRQEEERVLQCLGSPPNVLLALTEQELLQIARCESEYRSAGVSTSSSVSVTMGLRGADLVPVAASLETMTNLASSTCLLLPSFSSCSSLTPTSAEELPTQVT